MSLAKQKESASAADHAQKPASAQDEAPATAVVETEGGAARAFSLRDSVAWLARKLMFLWVKTKHLPEDLDEIGLHSNTPICYVLENTSISNLQVLEQACIDRGLPRPSDPILGVPDERRALIRLREIRGWLFLRRSDPRLSPRLTRLVEKAKADPGFDVKIVPVSIFWGRSPDKEKSFFKLLLSDTWRPPGRLRKLLIILVHGRQSMLQFSAPASLREFAAEAPDAARGARKLSRVLRVHYRRLRMAVIGPDLSQRSSVVRQLLEAPAVRRAIERDVKASGQARARVVKRARKYAEEIAADYSHSTVRAFDRLLSWLWNRLYDGVELSNLHNLDKGREGNEVIYVPCHRSHVDYLLLSYVLYHQGMVPPHIAAGLNMNLPILGRWLRRGGAFYLRRSFKGNRLYARVFDEYLSYNINRGVAIAYFIEGTRSRTGRLMQPKPGMLAMTVRSYLREHRRPVVFVPVYIGYEKLVEGRAYLGELGGSGKRKESLGDLLRTARKLRSNFGKVYFSAGEPIELQALLDEHAPGWESVDYSEDDRPEWLNDMVTSLGRRILVQINRSATVAPTNLLAYALLSTPKQAMTEDELLRLLDLFRDLLRDAPYSAEVHVTASTAAEIIAQGERLNVLARQPHPLGDVLQLRGINAVLQTYFRNNVLHLFALPSMVACCFLNNRSMSQERVLELCQIAYPYIRAELYLPWNNSEFPKAVRSVLRVLVELGLLDVDRESGVLVRPPARKIKAVQLSVLAQAVLQTLERYYITLALLQKHGSGTVTAGELENECHLLAQRMSLLHEFNAPEFFARSLFKNFIDRLIKEGVLRQDEDRHLTFDERIRTAERSAHEVLSDQIRHSILQVTHL